MSVVIIRPDERLPHVSPARTGLFLAVGLVLLAALFLAAKRGGERLAAPASFLSYLAPDKSFVCDAPAGWERHEAGVEGSEVAGVLFQQGAAKVEITSDQSSGATADMINAANAQQQQMREDMQSNAQANPALAQSLPTPPPPVSAVEQLHRGEAAEYAARYADYAEKPIHAFQSQLGDARLSEWTGRGSMGTRLHGYRVTMLGRDKRIRLNCRCPEGDWKTLQPAFVRVIHSVAQGPG